MMGSGPGGSVPTVSIIIVNWNSGGQLGKCLASIAATANDAYRIERIVVVDNASKDGSADGIEKRDLRVCVIRNPANRGFAAACNQGATGSEADYLLFLNPDTRLFPDSRLLAIKGLPDPRQTTCYSSTRIRGSFRTPWQGPWLSWTYQRTDRSGSRVSSLSTTTVE